MLGHLKKYYSFCRTLGEGTCTFRKGGINKTFWLFTIYEWWIMQIKTFLKANLCVKELRRYQVIATSAYCKDNSAKRFMLSWLTVSLV